MGPIVGELLQQLLAGGYPGNNQSILPGKIGRKRTELIRGNPDVVLLEVRGESFPRSGGY
jgi:hypothetical protein